MNQTITLQAQKCSTFFKKTIGLLKSPKPKTIFFETRFGIHTFGMKYPIDVIILDNKYLVKKMCKNLQPNRIFVWNPVYNKVLEMPPGYIQKHKITRDFKINVQM